jgi:hypothetical protein
MHPLNRLMCWALVISALICGWLAAQPPHLLRYFLLAGADLVALIYCSAIFTSAGCRHLNYRAEHVKDRVGNTLLVRTCTGCGRRLSVESLDGRQ